MRFMRASLARLPQGAGRSIPAQAIDGAADRFASFEAPDLVGDLLRRRLDERERGNVRRHADLRMRPERMTGRRRLVAKDVERRACESTAVEVLEQRVP